MRRFTTLALTLFLVFTGVASTATAQAVDEILAKMAGLYERAPFTMDYTVDMSFGQGEHRGTMAAVGKMLYADKTKTRLEMQNRMSLAGMDDLEMDLLVVGDGEFMWTEIDNPIVGGKQVVKVSVEAALEQAGGFGASPLGGGVDPMSQLEQLQEFFAFEIVEQKAGSVIVSGKATERMRELAGAEAMAVLGNEMTMAIDPETGAPHWMTMGPADSPIMEMRFENLRFLSPAEVPPDAFTYTPPEGVPVQEPLG